MITSENSNPTNHPQSSPLPDQKPSPSDHASSHLQLTRRSNFLRMLLIPAILAVILLILILIGRDQLHKKEYAKALQELKTQIDQFRDTHHRLPTPDDVSRFDLHSRSLSVQRINYPHLPSYQDDYPGDLLIAHAPLLRTRFIASGHCVLFLNGDIEWITPPQLQQHIEKRQQFLNKAILQHHEPLLK